MNDLIEGLKGIEVIADDFLVIGFGDNVEQATKNHDEHLLAFIQRCEERNIVLNAEKLCLWQTEVPFIGHVTTAHGLAVDPAKVKAITEMPAPENRAGVQRRLGMTQYLAKFLPNLSNLTKPLRDLTKKDVVFTWDAPQDAVFRKLKEAIT